MISMWDIRNPMVLSGCIFCYSRPKWVTRGWSVNEWIAYLFKTPNIITKILGGGEINTTINIQSEMSPRKGKKVYTVIRSSYGSSNRVWKLPSTGYGSNLIRRYWLAARWMELITYDNYWSGFAILFGSTLENPYDWGLCIEIFQVWYQYPTLYWRIILRKWQGLIQGYGLRDLDYHFIRWLEGITKEIQKWKIDISFNVGF